MLSPTPRFSDIAKDLSKDLNEVDLSLIESRFASIDGLTDINEQYFHLSKLCEDKSYVDPQWLLLAGRIKVYQNHQETPSKFSEAMEQLKAILHEGYYEFVKKHAARLDKMIVPERDFKFKIFSFETMKKSYLGRIKREDRKARIVERPGYMYLRVATFLYYSTKKSDPLEKVMAEIEEAYRGMSMGEYTHASPTLYNAGLARPQMASCFTLTVDDNIDSITEAWKRCALISKHSGGIGIDFTSLRHSDVGQFGRTKGVVPWVRVTDVILSTVDQCFTPETIVYTTDGPKSICDVVPGDKLVRSDGGLSTVLNPIYHDISESKQDFHSLSIKHYLEPVVVSDSHPFLAISGQLKGTPFKAILRRLETGKTVPTFIETQDLDTNCFVALPIPSYEKDLPRYSPEDCRMYGILLGDGYINKKRNEAKVYLNSTTKVNTADFVENYLRRNNINFWKHGEGKNLSIGWTINKHFPFNRVMLYDENGEKKFFSGFLHLPEEKLVQMFLGIMETDGTYRNGGEITLELSSRHVIESVRYILLRLGIATSGYVRDRRGSVSHLKRGDEIVTRKMTYVLRIPKTERVCEILDRKDPSPFVNFFVYDNKVWSRVTDNVVVETAPTGLVYDLEMEREEGIDSEITANYLTCIGTVHNGGKRKGSGTCYLRPWHIDIYEFLDLRKNYGDEEHRARNLFYALWISDEFMRRVKNDETWTLFCPAMVKGLEKKWGLEFEMAYRAFEEKAREGKIVEYRTINARDLWKAILLTQIEVGMPFMLYGDAVNRKSNQSNLGTIRLSNLCTEITLYTDDDTIGTCNLASVALGSCVATSEDGEKYFDFDKLEKITRQITRNLNQVIDRNFYPSNIPAQKTMKKADKLVEQLMNPHTSNKDRARIYEKWKELRQTSSSPSSTPIGRPNLENRPLGIGINGLDDVFKLLDLPWTSPRAQEINRMIAETMYYAAVRQSVDEAKIHGPYKNFKGSHTSKGRFQYDLWDMEEIEKRSTPDSPEIKKEDWKRRGPATDRYDWDTLRKEMVEYGIRNSLLIALMPTASSANLLDASSCFEPRDLFGLRTVLSGQFFIISKHLVRDLKEIDLWNTDTVRYLYTSQGSIQDIPEDGLEGKRLERLRFLKEKYKTVYELPQKLLLNMSLDRARYICQTQSFNLWMENPTFKTLNAYHFWGWERGAKTGMYYLRQTANTTPINYSIDSIRIPTKEKPKGFVCDGDFCTACEC